MSNHHDTGYKELFSYPELVRQLIEGFAPPEVAAMMDFATLTDHSGSYITPLFGEKFEDTNGKGQALLTLLLSYPPTTAPPDCPLPLFLKAPGPKTTVSA
ncbi:Rpn family recombination-promoting nuclease/putative transposase [Ectothiorhodospira variabilis]|uniref:Rpn family recombination-promoting nuclease/putative transposase n=1 Tax=Ectothiorhodospira variabilis TaxID=505694 RepID=UPI001EFAC137|nr:Rpn family recombination-promoting nuclease/putative transposase [Ectothiorhodospira variabilis]MCG5497656.1 Rpn family recombination-promoting nuclease/putative transposase [Ectothiorhodospira variabilis]